jgi:hypothetical protein
MHSAGDIIHLGLKVLLVLGLIAVNGFFVAAEFALVKIRATQLDTLVAHGHRRAKVARSIIANLNSFLSATQLGIASQFSLRCSRPCWPRCTLSLRRCGIRFPLPSGSRR